MKAAFFIKKSSLKNGGKPSEVIARLREGGVEMYGVNSLSDLCAGTDMIMSFGGDGTFLTAAGFAYEADIPVLGVNLGRMGFLSAADPDEVAGCILDARYGIEERPMLCASGQYALNEVCVYRMGTEAIGVEVAVDGMKLPVYWADGVLVSTTSGSTAYNLSIGGPICVPGSGVLVISPIAPHNLGVRPLVVPDSAEVRMKVISRHGGAVFSCDNRSCTVEDGFETVIRKAGRPLKCVTAGNTGFIDALRSRFFWGMDVRNSTEQ